MTRTDHPRPTTTRRHDVSPTPSPLIVVTGASGYVGRRVVAGLLTAGHRVRAVSRRPDAAGLPGGAEVVFGDLGDPSSLEEAFAGASQLVLIAVPAQVASVVARAQRAGIEHVVVVSSGAVTVGYDTTYNAVVEAAVMASELEWTIVRPGEFATNSLLMWGPSIRAERGVLQPFAAQVGQPIHEGDVADVVLANLLDPARRGRIDTIVGPQSLTKAEQVAAIADAIGERITLEDISPDSARDFYTAQGGFAAANAAFLFGFESYDGIAGAVDQPPGKPAPTHDPFLTLDDITATPARPYHQWARDHAADFR